jgi:hypothetical protein
VPRPRSPGRLEPSRRGPPACRSQGGRLTHGTSSVISRGAPRQTLGNASLHANTPVSHVLELASSGGGSHQWRHGTEVRVRAVRRHQRCCRRGGRREELVRNAGARRPGCGHGAAAAAGRRPRGEHPRRHAQGTLVRPVTTKIDVIKRGIHTRASRQLQLVIFVLWFLRVQGPDNALVRGGVRDAGGRGGVRHGVRQGRRRGATRSSRFGHVADIRCAGYDTSQGSEVREREKGRHLKDDKHAA